MLGTTAIARNYLAHARVLATSFLDCNPGARFIVLCVDAFPGELGDELFELLTGVELVGGPELVRRGFMYGTQELVSSMKPELLVHLVGRGSGPVIFLDADGCVYRPLDDLGELACVHGIVLSPHRPGPPLDRDSEADFRAEAQIVQAGVFNAGLIAVGSKARPFLDWWRRRTARHCIHDVESGFLLCQTWLALVPVLFDHHVLRDPGLNVMGWNLENRDIEWAADEPSISGRPLGHFHFCGRFNPHRPHELSPHGGAWPGWPSLDDRPGVARLALDYARRLLAAGYDQAISRPPRYSVLPDGSPIDPGERRAYRVALIEAELAGDPKPGNPLRVGGCS